jgi:hypothetical protein
MVAISENYGLAAINYEISIRNFPRDTRNK